MSPRRPRRPRLPPSGSQVSYEEGQRLIAQAQTEDDLLAFCRDLALVNRWLFYHTYRSDRSDAGFYDVVAIHAPMRRIVLAELKTTAGAFKAEQNEWGSAAAAIAGAWAQVMAYRDPSAPLATAVLGPVPSAIYPAPRIETWPLAYFRWRPTREDKDEMEKVFRWPRR